MKIKGEKKKTSSSPCANLRTAYHNCFNKWYSEKFLKGEWDKEECASEWQNYRACLSEHLEEKHLRRLLEAEGNVKLISEIDPGNPVGGSTDAKQ